jgi:hypothetical protein
MELSRSATQKFRHILWNPQFNYRIHMSPPLLPVLSEKNPVHTTPSYFSKIHFSIVTYSGCVTTDGVWIAYWIY